MTTDAGDNPCPGGAVLFQLTAADGGAGFFVAQALPACYTSNWLKVLDHSGVERPLVHPSPGVDCATCTAPAFSSVCATTSPAPTRTATFTWDGRYFARGSCGTAGAACVQPQCVAPGRYVAAMCGADDAQQTMGRRCVDVQFDYPAAGPVTGALPREP